MASVAIDSSGSGKVPSAAVGAQDLRWRGDVDGPKVDVYRMRDGGLHWDLLSSEPGQRMSFVGYKADAWMSDAQNVIRSDPRFGTDLDLFITAGRLRNRLLCRSAHGACHLSGRLEDVLDQRRRLYLGGYVAARGYGKPCDARPLDRAGRGGRSIRLVVRGERVPAHSGRGPNVAQLVPMLSSRNPGQEASRYAVGETIWILGRDVVAIQDGP